ncbi:MAG TPA: hypothetical protein VK639_12100 [Terriglobales bacterium]|nr:hypothetical protein [Terriglobales bacterium]
MRIRIIILAVFFASSLVAFTHKEETLAELITRAESSKLDDRPRLYTEIARRQVKAADQLYAAGKPEEARAAVRDVVEYSDKASDAATQSGKKLKDTEIAVRKMVARLRDINRTLAFEDQASVEEAVNHLEQVRTQLLSQMFGKKENK